MDEFADILVASAAELAIHLSQEQVEQCEAFSDLVVEWNEKINLTSLVAPADMAIKHFIDSFACLRCGQWPEGGRVIDVGTGAGFPGIALAILRPDMHYVLVDALKKRIDFLRLAVQELGLPRVDCVHGRAEELGRRAGLRELCDVAVARAVARLPVLLEYCLPFVRVGGGFLAMKGPEGRTEVTEAQHAARLLGAGKAQVELFTLPGGAGSRSLIWYPKETKTSTTYPRKPGTPGKDPL